MKHRIYSLDKFSQLDDIKLTENDIVLFDFDEDEDNEQFICYDLHKEDNIINSSLIEILDIVVEKYNFSCHYDLVIYGGDFLLNQYLALFINIMGGSVFLKDFKIPDLPVTVDVDDLQINRSKLKSQTNKDVYDSLPNYWKSIYKKHDDIFTLSKFGDFLIGKENR